MKRDTGDTAETLKKLTLALEENSELKAELKALRESLAARKDTGSEIASGADTVDLRFCSAQHKDWQVVISWDELFEIAGPMMLSDTPDYDILYSLSFEMAHRAARAQANPQVAEKSAGGAQLAEDDFRKILYRFLALDFIEPVTLVRQTDHFGTPETEHLSGFRLTKNGVHKLARLRAVKRSG